MRDLACMQVVRRLKALPVKDLAAVLSGVRPCGAIHLAPSRGQDLPRSSFPCTLPEIHNATIRSQTGTKTNRIHCRTSDASQSDTYASIASTDHIILIWSSSPVLHTSHGTGYEFLGIYRLWRVFSLKVLVFDRGGILCGSP